MNNDEKQVSKTPDSYLHLLDTIGQTFLDARRRAIGLVHNAQVRAYWNIGRHIVEYEQDGIPKAEYGTALLERLADDLRKRHGHGFSRSNVSYMRLFYVNIQFVRRCLTN